ncbi:hypothetical protein RRG08_040077 [Elysia crispata]|uniref:Uncharacterized protein n=1 Tax=Elysia crispata TaxID=231223 RepID=A0AAE0XVV8_9GAST|nr:hypothetical protein RRG08_040077 [Elysia crispata]
MWSNMSCRCHRQWSTGQTLSEIIVLLRLLIAWDRKKIAVCFNSEGLLPILVYWDQGSKCVLGFSAFEGRAKMGVKFPHTLRGKQSDKGLDLTGLL